MTNKRLLPIVQEFNVNVRKVNNLVLLDRDGTLNRDLGYTYKLSDLVVLPTNIEFIKSLVNKESSVICITNQSGIGRGYFSIEEAKKGACSDI
jgi:UDP-N-acetylmuramoyl-tripeptide--D-alanyl-D-alanine ligase